MNDALLAAATVLSLFSTIIALTKFRSCEISATKCSSRCEDDEG